jgi:hypothetical protein
MADALAISCRDVRRKQLVDGLADNVLRDRPKHRSRGAVDVEISAVRIGT